MTLRIDVLTVGAGPAGMAAAAAAAEGGYRVLLLDDNAAPGGQIWREGIALHPRKQRLAARLLESGAEVLPAHRVFALPQPGVALALHEGAGGSRPVTIRYRHMVIATGARERFLPFPGWTLPGVFGAGGLQALVQGGYPVAGKRVLVAGSGPLLLAVAAHLRQAGATVVGIAEQAPLAQLARFGLALATQPGKLLQGAGYRAALRGTPYWAGTWPVQARAGSGHQLAGVRLSDGRGTREIPCDLLACGFHLVPNTELAELAGAALHNGFVQVDHAQHTTAPGALCVGEPTGIAGLDAALLQGEIAGRVCAGLSVAALQTQAARHRSFAAALAKSFALQPQLRVLARPETTVCRCEDVPLSATIGRTGWADAKLATRCGMGACQGRVCGPALAFVHGWQPASVRPPLFPVPLAALSATYEETP